MSKYWAVWGPTLFNSTPQSVEALVSPNPLGILGARKVFSGFSLLPHHFHLWARFPWISPVNKCLAVVHGPPTLGLTASLPQFLQEHHPHKAQIWGSEKNYGTETLNSFKLDDGPSYPYKSICLITVCLCALNLALDFLILCPPTTHHLLASSHLWTQFSALFNVDGFISTSPLRCVTEGSLLCPTKPWPVYFGGNKLDVGFERGFSFLSPVSVRGREQYRGQRSVWMYVVAHRCLGFK